MKWVGMMLLATGLCYAQTPGDFHPSSTNVLDAEYPRVDSARRAEFRIKAPDAAKVHVLWIGVGTEEPAMMRAGLLRMHTSLTDAKVEHIFYESPGTLHEWLTWRRDLKDFAPRLFQPVKP
ncbi:MAG: hypothetical protein P4L40_05725 [Terracidiphilus sp.]|nr:hypothetical protein [Terracidiphilus sp.]